MRQTRVIKVLAVCFAIILPIIGSAIRFYPQGALTHEFLMAIFSGVFSVELGLIVVNLYLKRMEKRDAVQQLFRYVHESIAEVDDYILNAGIRFHGQKGWADLIATYIENERTPSVLSETQIDSVFEMSKAEDLLNYLGVLKSSIGELMIMSGWNLDSRVLSSGLSILTTLRKLNTEMAKKIESVEYRYKITEMILDVYLSSNNLWGVMKELSGLP